MQDQILTLTITAVDPVAFALTWLLAWVAKSPAVQSSAPRRARDGWATIPTRSRWSQLPYLTATCQETLRIHPILPTVSGRRLTAPMEIQGYHLEAGINVAPCRLSGASARGTLPRAASLPPGAVPVAAIRPERILPVRRK